MDVRLLLLVLAGCSGKARTPDDAVHPTTPVAAAPADAAAQGSDAARPAPTTGDAQIRVEWQKVPVAARASAGPTPCGTPRQPQVAPTTTWGIPDALVTVEGAAPPPAEVHVRVGDCALAPRIALGASLVLDSAATKPTTVTVAKKTVMLPVAGHAVAVALDAGGTYELATPGDTAVVVASAGAVTDASGVVLVKDLAPGVHAVTAWLPARGGQPERRASGTVTIVAGDLADLTLQLVPP